MIIPVTKMRNSHYYQFYPINKFVFTFYVSQREQNEETKTHTKRALSAHNNFGLYTPFSLSLPLFCFDGHRNNAKMYKFECKIVFYCMLKKSKQ